MMKFNKIKSLKIKYLDGLRFRNAILASTKVIAQNEDYLNKINVFPVPDGDTGTNLFVTMNQISIEISEVSEKSISSMSDKLAEFALMSAQGNSGAIMAQFFYGFSEGVKGKWKITTENFAAAVQNAKESAFKALSDPKEGTIVTVISDWANFIEKKAKVTEDFSELLKTGLQTAKESLSQTTHKLEVLRKAGVVDAGAMGFVNILEGIENFINKGKIKKIFPNISISNLPSNIFSSNHNQAKIKFRYCTDFLISGIAINHNKLKAALKNIGDSLIVAGSPEKTKIHIHTNEPDIVYDIASSYGEIINKKTDDMFLQYQDLSKKEVINSIGIITDSACDLPYKFIEEHNIQTIPLKISFGSETLLDKVDIKPIEFYDRLLHSPTHPTTSQPALGDIKNIFDKIVPNHDSIISIHIPRAISGTLQSIESGAELFGDKKITCIDSKSISAGLGLIVMEAADAIKENLSLEQVIKRVNTAVDNTKIFISLPTLKYLVKSGRVSKQKGFIGKLIRLNPIISFDEDGKIGVVAKSLGEKNAMKHTLKMAIKQAQKYDHSRFIVAHANAYQKAEWYVNQLKKHFNINEQIPIVDAAPALGVHAGPGTAGIAITGYY